MIVIDGNIGCGKSTVLDRLAELGHTVHKEKIDLWPLEEFYQDRKTWAMPLQLAVFNSMKPVQGIHERCPDSAYHVFWREQESPESRVVNDFYQRHRWTPEVHIYLRASPEWCMKNIHKRTQAGDSGVTLEYLRELHTRYEDFFHSVPHVEINAERTIDDILSDTIRCLP